MKLSTLTFMIFILTAVPAYSELISTQTVASPVIAETISGKVMIQDKTPMDNGFVLLFNKLSGAPPHKYKYWRVPDLIFNTDNNGKFSLNIPEGTYYLIVAQKNPESELGPPKDRAFVYFHGDAEGNALPLVITPDTKLNLGLLSTSFEWSPDLIERDKGITAVEGIVSDMEGKPVERVMVFAYLSENATGKPAYISDRTDKNGRYQLRVYGAGTYFLRARSLIGGVKPQEGELNNVTKEFRPVKVTLVKEQKLQGVALRVDRFLKQNRKETVNSKTNRNDSGP